MSNQYGLPPQQPRATEWPAQPPMHTQPGYAPAYTPQRPRPRRKRRVFLWVFLAIQALFVIWVIAGAFTKTGPATSQIASACYHHHWWPLFKSQADCVTHYGGALNDAGNIGKGLGIALIVILWFVVDVILGISYGVYKLATRGRYR